MPALLLTDTDRSAFLSTAPDLPVAKFDASESTHNVPRASHLKRSRSFEESYEDNVCNVKRRKTSETAIDDLLEAKSELSKNNHRSLDGEITNFSSEQRAESTTFLDDDDAWHVDQTVDYNPTACYMDFENDRFDDPWNVQAGTDESQSIEAFLDELAAMDGQTGEKIREGAALDEGDASFWMHADVDEPESDDSDLEDTRFLPPELLQDSSSQSPQCSSSEPPPAASLESGSSTGESGEKKILSIPWRERLPFYREFRRRSPLMQDITHELIGHLEDEQEEASEEYELAVCLDEEEDSSTTTQTTCLDLKVSKPTPSSVPAPPHTPRLVTIHPTIRGSSGVDNTALPHYLRMLFLCSRTVCNLRWECANESFETEPVVQEVMQELFPGDPEDGPALWWDRLINVGRLKEIVEVLPLFPYPSDRTPILRGTPGRRPAETGGFV
ncbi:hypothetical protein BD413DRAFT_674376 [Trametes elegans]|nr:hypothetical protein BD413DRAFT_674376 [Trametes elegans]